MALIGPQRRGQDHGSQYHPRPGATAPRHRAHRRGSHPASTPIPGRATRRGGGAAGAAHRGQPDGGRKPAAGRRRAARPWTVPEIYKLFPILQERAHPRHGLCRAGSSKCWRGPRPHVQPPAWYCSTSPPGLAPVIVDQLADIFNRVAGQGTALLLIEQNLSLVAGWRTATWPWQGRRGGRRHGGGHARRHAGPGGARRGLTLFTPNPRRQA